MNVSFHPELQSSLVLSRVGWTGTAVAVLGDIDVAADRMLLTWSPWYSIL